MPFFEQLEPRILLSADLIPLPLDAEPTVLPDTPDETAPAPQSIATIENSTTPAIDTPQDVAGNTNGDDQTVADDKDTAVSDPQPVQQDSEIDQTPMVTQVSATTPDSQEIIFINDDLEGFDDLQLDLENRDNSAVVILNSSEDGLTQIHNALESIDSAQALHFFTHGNDSSIKLGSSWVSSSNLDENRETIRSWGEHLSTEADILFYGCDLASSSDGTDLLQEISELTGADVAASDDATGHQKKGGDWVLEYTSGAIETEIAVSTALQSNWLHILAEETIADNFETGSYSNSDGSVNWATDWVEIGESDGVSAGNVKFESGELHIVAADNDEAERGISRKADLSGATSAFLSFDTRGIWQGLFSEVSVEIRADSGDDWSTLKNHYIINWSVPYRFDITNFISDTTEIRFISNGTDLGGKSAANGQLFVDNLHIDYTTDSWSKPLWLSTEGTVNNGGQSGVDSWNDADIIGINNSNPLFGPKTEGEFAMAAQLSTFAEGADINALHYVTTNMTIGASKFELQVGDLLISTENPDQKSFGNIDASGDDIIHFRPSTSGDYSGGTFTILFEGMAENQKVNGLTLVEKDVTVGDRNLHAGDLLFIRDGVGHQSDVYHYATLDVEPGSGTTNGTVSVLLEGDDEKVDISEPLQGIDVVERTITIGNTELTEGTLLLTTKNNDNISGEAVDNHDIFALDVTTTSDPSGSTANLGDASASIFFDGSDVSFNQDNERIDALTLTVKEPIPEPTFTGVSFDAQTKTITLTGTNLDYVGAIGENVTDRLDWSKISWDVNNDGATTPDIDFIVHNVSTVLTSSTSLTITLTGQKANQITGTSGYGEVGGIDTMTILPGFTKNPGGQVATTDGLIDAPIATTTAPVGVHLSNSTLPENTNTTGGFIVGTLSTVDAETSDSHTYTITGGVDRGLFRIGGAGGNELTLEAGLLDYETKSSYVVEITVTDGSGQTDSQTHTISVSDINEVPVITANNLTISEDQTVTLTTTDLAATDLESVDGTLIFAVKSVAGGQFENTDSPGVAITGFSQADIAAGKILFIDDGDETAPDYSISVSDGSLTSADNTATISFTDINDVPVIANNSLILSEGQRITLTTGDLSIVDGDNSATELNFTVDSVAGGQFERATTPGTAITSFSQEDLALGRIQFVHNGSEIAPAYSLTLSDGVDSSSPSAANITYTAINDQPVIQQNSLNISLGESQPITSGQLLAVDPDDNNTNLTFTISNIEQGYFSVDSVVSTTFTQQDINEGKVVFHHNYSESAPAYDVVVTDNAGLSSGPEAAAVTYNAPANQAPSLNTSGLTLVEGQTITLSNSNFLATDIDSGPASLTYTVTNVTGGYFEFSSNQGVAITSFTQSNITAGEVRFVHDGGENSPTYSVTVSDGYLTDIPDGPNDINFTQVNDAPILGNNSINLNEGDTVAITTALLSATDVDDPDPNLTFTISNVTGGMFTTKADSATPIFSFTQAEVTAGNIQFIHDGGKAAPAYQVTATDLSGLPSTTEAAIVLFTEVNDAPQLINNNLVIDEGGTVTLSAAQLSATDPETISADLIFTVSSLSGGQFERTSLPGSEITSFNQADILAGKIVFVHDGNEAAPVYRIAVTDNSTVPLTTTPSDATITYSSVNDAPDLTVNSVTLSEGDTVTLNSSMLAATDSDSSEPDLLFTVTDLVAGIFTNTSDPTTPITSFTQAQVTNGEIQVIHDGGEVALSYNISVSDGNLTSTASPAIINYTGINDAPTIDTPALVESYTENTVQPISDISIADSDGGSAYQVSLRLSDTLAGTLSSSNIGTATGTFAGGTLTISGTNISDVNGMLAATTFTPTTNYTKSFTISISANDGIHPSAVTTKTLQPISVNVAPTTSPLDMSGTYTEDTTYDLDDITVADTDEDEILSATLTLASPSRGNLLAAGGASFDSTSGVWSITGTATEVNNALSLVSFTPAADSFQDTTIAVQIEDGGENGVTPLTGTINLTGQAVADAPVVSNVGSSTLTPGEPIYIRTNSADGDEVTHFQITEIIDGELYLIDGVTPVVENDFITISDGAAGLIFTPNSGDQGSFKVKGSVDGRTVALQGPETTSTITVSNVKTPPGTITTSGGGGTHSGTDGEGVVEKVRVIDETNSIDETLELAAGQGIDADTPVTQETQSMDNNDETGSRDDEKVSEKESNDEEDVDESLSYINADKIVKSPSANPGIEISAAFDTFTFDLSFDTTDVHSFSLFLDPTQSQKSQTISLSASPEDSPLFSTSDYDLLDLEYRDRSFEEYQSVRKSLENFREQAEQEASIEKTIVGSAIAASTGLSAGYVIWLLRSGALLSSILSSLPAWQLADPLAVLTGTKKSDEEEDDSIESIIKKGASQSPQGKNAQQNRLQSENDRQNAR